MGISFTKELGAVLLLLLCPSVMLEDVVVVVTVTVVLVEVVIAGISFSFAATFDGVGVDGVVGGAVVEDETMVAAEGGGGCSVIVVVFYKMLGRNRNAKNQSTNSKRLCR